MEYSVELRWMGAEELTGGRREGVETGGKVLLPASVLEDLVVGGPRLPNPLLFSLRSTSAAAPLTHVGVLEFVADPGTAVLPAWVISHLQLQPQSTVTVSLARGLPVACFARFKPSSGDFLHISDPRAVLESCLRGFACLTTGDLFHIQYNNRVYGLLVEETRPAPAVNIIECDMEVEFSAAEDEESASTGPPPPRPGGACSTSLPHFVPFSTEGRRLDGKPTSPAHVPAPQPSPSPGLPDYSYTSDSITFFRNFRVKDKNHPSAVEE